MALEDRIDPNLLKNIDQLPVKDQEEILGLLEELESAEKKDRARSTFIGFVNSVWPAFRKLFGGQKNV